MLMIVGECWSKDDEENGVPFTGSSARLLAALLSQAGVAMRDAYLTNVFSFRPPSGDVKNICGPKTEGIKGMPALVKGKFAHERYTHELDRLFTEITNVQPTCILALGATAAWALLRTSGIRNIRGAPLATTVRGREFKVFPTYSPAAIMREWRLRPILLSDLHKLREELTHPEVRRPSRKIWIEPSLDDLYTFEQKHILPAPQLSIDIETSGTQITCIGFAPTKDVALVVPFTDTEAPDGNYWKSFSEEVSAWNWVRRMCSLDKAIVGQNFLYDMHHLWRNYGITVPHAKDDTMLLHHALQPEMEKGLGFLGSIYTTEASWKFMRHTKATIKRED